MVAFLNKGYCVKHVSPGVVGLPTGLQVWFGPVTMYLVIGL